MIEHLLHGSPVSAAGIDLACEALGEIAARWPAGRPLAGARDRRRRRRHPPAARSPRPDPAPRSATPRRRPMPEQASRLGFAIAGAPGANASCWSPRDPADQFADSRFDVILAAHACARLQIDPAGLSGLRDLLAPGGVFLAVEPAPNPLWDVVFGRYAGWWQNGDGAARGVAAAFRGRLEQRSCRLRVCRYRRGPALAGPWPSCGILGPCG